MPASLRVAVVGSGPSGLYVAETLGKKVADVEVDVFDRLLCPFGLLRYGVAPDHHKIKALIAPFSKLFDRPGFRFIGGVDFGRDIDLCELREHYDAVVYATGSPRDRSLEIAGEELAGSISAGRLVAWYSGHPEAGPVALEAETAVVFGMGNVSIDVARLLTKDPQELAATDIPDAVLDELQRSRVRDVHIIGRRGPLEAKFSTKELVELSGLPGVDIVVDPAELVVADEEAGGIEPRRNLELFREWSERPATGAQRRIHFHFGLRPTAFLGDESVERLALVRAQPDVDGVWTSTGEVVELEAQLAIRSVGYRGAALKGVPFDAGTATIPHRDGRVQRDGKDSLGEYVVGWVKRGPTGVIGTNKADAIDTVASILADVDRLDRAPRRDPAEILALLDAHGVSHAGWPDWLRIDASEVERGAPRGAARVKLADTAELLAVVRRRADAEPTPSRRRAPTRSPDHSRTCRKRRGRGEQWWRNSPEWRPAR